MRSGGATYRSIAAPAEPGRLKEMLAAGAGQAARSKFRVQRGQDLVGHRHAADDHTRSTLPVVVGASGHQKPVEERVPPLAISSTASSEIRIPSPFRRERIFLARSRRPSR